MACEEIGAFSGEQKRFVDFVLQQDSDGSCQNFKVGEHSPGPVLDDEKLARFVFCPAHVKKIGDEYGQIDESLFLDITGIGGSVNRLMESEGAVPGDVHLRGESMAALVRQGSLGRTPQPDRQYLGAIKLATKEVRALAVDEVACRVRVYDTSRGPNDQLHGDIVANMRGLDGEKKALRKQLRVALYVLAKTSGLYPSPHFQGPYELDNCGLVVHSG